MHPPSAPSQIIRRAARLPFVHRFRLAWRLAWHSQAPARARLPLLALFAYLAMPLDIVPDFIPVLGQLDDLLIAGIAVWWFLRMCPPAPALAVLDELEATPLNVAERALPWIIGAMLVLAGVGLAAKVIGWW